MCEYTLSVIIPNYNNSKYLEECVSSIVQQTYEIKEIIIVDDCSLDNSVAVIEKMKEKYPLLKLIKLPNNKGVSNARNIGIEKAEGEYITLIDSDDFYYNKDKLYNEMSLIKKYKKEYGKDVVAYSKVVRVSENGLNIQIPPKKVRKYNVGNVRNALLVEKNFDTIMRDYCIKKEIIQNIGGFNINKSYYEDFELLIKISKVIEFYCTYENGTAYRNNIKGLSKRKINESRKKKKEIFNEQTKKMKFYEKKFLLIKRYYYKIINRMEETLRKSNEYMGLL